jgi:hypothetical protein
MKLEEFITFIQKIGFSPVKGNSLWPTPSTASDSCVYRFSYNGYNIILDYTRTRFGLEHNVIIDSPSRTNQRNFDLSDLELLEIHFKSEIRNIKLNELGI